ncbi:MAG TPA: superoxide dismutase [Fe], partial [Acidimicrobiaceae bacterium]|nr:superoxide dismutase [Fe] [Acidimicrobiaceae bacterium]
MAFELPALPYAQDALAPTISAETMEYHYGKHHQTYVDNLNKAVAGTADENASLEDIIMKAEGPLFNNAAQVWNHTFFWNSLSPNGGGQPTGAIADRIAADFGGYDEFRAQITDAGLTQFGSGWAWLVEKDGKLAIMKTPNADLPMKHG